MISEKEYPTEETPKEEKENFQERFCSETLKVTVLPENGLDLLKKKGLI